MSIKSYKFENVIQKSEKPFESRRPWEILFLHRFFRIYTVNATLTSYFVRKPEKSRNHIIVWTSSDFKEERLSRTNQTKNKNTNGENKNLLTDAQRVVPRRETFAGFLDGNTYVEF